MAEVLAVPVHLPPLLILLLNLLLLLRTDPVEELIVLLEVLAVVGLWVVVEVLVVVSVPLVGALGLLAVAAWLLVVALTGFLQVVVVEFHLLRILLLQIPPLPMKVLAVEVEAGVVLYVETVTEQLAVVLAAAVVALPPAAAAVVVLAFVSVEVVVVVAVLTASNGPSPVPVGEVGYLVHHRRRCFLLRLKHTSEVVSFATFFVVLGLMTCKRAALTKGLVAVQEVLVSLLPFFVRVHAHHPAVCARLFSRLLHGESFRYLYKHNLLF